MNRFAGKGELEARLTFKKQEIQTKNQENQRPEPKPKPELEPEPEPEPEPIQDKISTCVLACFFV